jgi:hypothetical protein
MLAHGRKLPILGQFDIAVYIPAEGVDLSRRKVEPECSHSVLCPEHDPEPLHLRQIFSTLKRSNAL